MPERPYRMKGKTYAHLCDRIENSRLSEAAFCAMRHYGSDRLPIDFDINPASTDLGRDHPRPHKRRRKKQGAAGRGISSLTGRTSPAKRQDVDGPSDQPS